MSIDNVSRDGRPWTTVGQFQSWELADQKLKELLNNDKGLRVKVRQRRASPVFSVVTRRDGEHQVQGTEERQRNPKGKKARKAEENQSR